MRRLASGLALALAWPASAVDASDHGPPVRITAGEYHAAEALAAEVADPVALPVLAVLRGYQLVAPFHDVVACPMVPSCSRYAMLAFARLDPARAAMRVADRLVREAGELDGRYPRVAYGDRVLYLDEPEP